MRWDVVMVPLAGIEPALPKERDFESRASTNSAREASSNDQVADARDYNQRSDRVNTISCPLMCLLTLQTGIGTAHSRPAVKNGSDRHDSQTI